jgi:hypothetical protein
MSLFTRILLFIILPTIAVLSYPPSILENALLLIVIVLVVFILLGVLVWQGRSPALTLSIFIQGLNIIIRLMMFFPNSKPAGQPVDFIYVATSLLGMIISAYLMFRLDRGDIQAQMVT